MSQGEAAWAASAIRTVTSRGLMGGSAATFRPTYPLTRGALARLEAGLSGVPVPQPAGANVEATMSELDAGLVHALGLGPAATAFRQAARTAGLHPPARFGTEVVARLLDLRTDHPTALESLERLPGDVATRADAAYSAAQIIDGGSTRAADVARGALRFSFTRLGPWQQRVLRTAVRFIGYPYVWGGTSEHPQVIGTRAAPGGFDCSGFAWRVYKLQHYAGASALASVLRGRTTYEMSGEVPRSERIPFAQLRPADIVFFGSRGTSSRPGDVGHMAIYLGGGWMIQSSGEGVALAPLTGWYRTRFAWGRRPLAEARLL
jgi:cell wall-associated NlpC family hydrolase